MPDTYTIPPEVMAREVGDETVILDLATGSYYGLDRVGTRVWQLLVAGRPHAAILDALLAEYETTRPVLERDLAALMDALRQRGLVRVE